MNEPRQYKPLILSYRELESVLFPYIVTNAWGIDTIRDLWMVGAPIPGVGEERRVILPGKLMEWLKDVLNTNGQPLDARAGIYSQLARQTN